MTTPTSAGWFEDPDEPDQLRYFDGIVWTSHVTPRRSQSAAQSTIGLAPHVPAEPAPTSEAQPASPWGYPGSAAPLPPMARSDVRPGELLPDGAVLARWWHRLLARIVDNILTAGLSFVLSFLLLPGLRRGFEEYLQASMAAAADGGTPQVDVLLDAMTAAVVPVTAINVLVALVYETVFLVWRAATPGKMLLGTRVRGVDADEGISLTVALRRQAIPVVAGAAPAAGATVGLAGNLLTIVDAAWLLVDPRRQCLHDKMADTVVVRSR